MLNLRLFHSSLNPRNHFSTVLIKTNCYTTSCKYRFSNNLSSVISLIQEPFAITTSVFPHLTCDIGKLYIPYGTMEKYKATDGWKEFLWMKENAPTDIDNVKAEDKSDNIYYDLKGNRLDAPKRGLNIINGKKYVIK